MTNSHTFQLAGSAPENYRKYLVPVWMHPWAELLVSAGDVKPGDRVMDLACGTGVVALAAAPIVGQGGSVLGLDTSSPMLAVARTAAEEAGVSVEWLERDASDTGLTDGSIDVVLSQQGYQYFPDRMAVLHEMFRILVPGGRIAMSLWESHSAYTSALVEALEKYVSAEHAAQQHSQRQTPRAAQLQQEVATAGFVDVTVKVQKQQIRTPPARDFVPQHVGAMPIAAAFAALDPSVRVRMLDFMDNKLALFAVEGGLVYPDAVNVVSAARP